MPSTQPNLQTEEAEADSLDLNFELRRIVGRAVGFVQGRQATESFFALTYEELAQAQIDRIEGVGFAGRPNELERIDSIENELLGAVEQIRSIPPENFLLADPDKDVNTLEDPPE